MSSTFSTAIQISTSRISSSQSSDVLSTTPSLSPSKVVSASSSTSEQSTSIPRTSSTFEQSTPVPRTSSTFQTRSLLTTQLNTLVATTSSISSTLVLTQPFGTTSSQFTLSTGIIESSITTSTLAPTEAAPSASASLVSQYDNFGLVGCYNYDTFSNLFNHITAIYYVTSVEECITKCQATPLTLVVGVTYNGTGNTAECVCAVSLQPAAPRLSQPLSICDSVCPDSDEYCGGYDGNMASGGRNQHKRDIIGPNFANVYQFEPDDTSSISLITASSTSRPQNSHSVVDLTPTSASMRITSQPSDTLNRPQSSSLLPFTTSSPPLACQSISPNQNLIKNGDFECACTDFWFFTGTTPAISPYGYGFNSNYSISISGPTILYESIDTCPGTKYNISFAYITDGKGELNLGVRVWNGDIAGIGDGDISLKVEVQAILDITMDYTSWTVFYTSFQATGSQTVLAFNFTSTMNSGMRARPRALEKKQVDFGGISSEVLVDSFECHAFGMLCFFLSFLALYLGGNIYQVGR